HRRPAVLQAVPEEPVPPHQAPPEVGEHGILRAVDVAGRHGTRVLRDAVERRDAAEGDQYEGGRGQDVGPAIAEGGSGRRRHRRLSRAQDGGLVARAAAAPARPSAAARAAIASWISSATKRFPSYVMWPEKSDR